MIVMGKINRSVLATVALAVCVVLVGNVGQAVAAEPWWHVTTISAPASPNDSEAMVELDIANLGDTTAGGVLDENLLSGKTPITVVDQLPAGVTATHAYAEGGGGALNKYGRREHPLLRVCTIEEQTVTCHDGVPVRPYEHLEIVIRVTVTQGAGNGENEVNVSGGGAPSALSRRPLAVESRSPYGVQTYELAPEEEGGLANTQAGSHPFQLTTTLMFNTQAVYVEKEPGGIAAEHESGPEVQPLALTKDLRFNLPAGLIGNPTPLPKCSLREFTLLAKDSEAKCPNNTVVGVASPILTTTDSELWAPEVYTTPLYSLEPSVGEPAKFGFQSPIGPVILDTSVRTGGDYGVVVTVPNITEGLGLIGNIVTLWGVPDDSRHDTSRNVQCLTEETGSAVTGGPESSCSVSEKQQPFVIMPTSCEAPLYTTIEADSWSEQGKFTEPFGYTFKNSEGEPVSEDGCNRLSFEPSVSLTPDGQEGSTPTGLTVDEHVPEEESLNPTGLAESSVKNTLVALPAGVAIDPSGADGLSACSQGEVSLNSPGEQSCPESSKIGTVEIKTPLLPNPLVGAAYLAEQDNNPFGSLIAMYIVVYDPISGVRIKVAGEVQPNPVTGQLVSTFKETPELPFEDLKLNFFGGSRAPLSTPALCGGYTTTASVEPWSGNAAVDSSSEFQVTSGPNDTPCSNPLPFDPTLTTGSLNIQAGAFTPFRMTMSREDGNQNLDGIQLKMPSGLLGTLSSVKLCEEAQANAGTCGPESLIGHTIVSVGLGGNPYTVNAGEVFITGPYKGAPYGLSIVNPAKAGPFNLGKVIVRAKIEVNPENAALTITTDTTGPYSIPQILDGIPLQIKHVEVSIDRPDFTFNPTNCAPQEIGGALTSSQGATSTLHVPFQVTNCAVLKFKPILTVSTSGKTSRKNGASLNVKLTYPKAAFGTQANIGKVKVDLPKRLPSRLTTLQKACPASVFEANPAACPPDSRVGSATATTPVLPVHLEGPAYFVSHGGQKFPELIVALSGEGVTVYLHGETFITPQGITSSTFRTIPDVPIGVFELKLPQGTDSALAANGDLCTSKLVMPTIFVGANGVSLKQSTPITATGCPKKAKRSKKSEAGKHKKASKKK
ncbi:MAG: hypothetical protein WBQ21_04865 [Solirubrobacteraceae bacterium]